MESCFGLIKIVIESSKLISSFILGLISLVRDFILGLFSIFLFFSFIHEKRISNENKNFI